MSQAWVCCVRHVHEDSTALQVLLSRVIGQPVWSTLCHIPIVTRTIHSSSTTRPSPHQQTAITRACPYQGCEAGGDLEDPLDRKRPSEDEAGLLLLPFWKAARCESLRCRSGSRTEQQPLVALPINVRHIPVQPAKIGFLRGEGEYMDSDVGEEG